jgi:FeS assembly SUF system protein
MGLFSFLTGKGSDQTPAAAEKGPAVAPSPAVAERSPAEPAPAVPASEPEEDSWGLNTAALTAPPPPPPADVPVVGPPDPQRTADLQGKIIDVIKTVFDPEIPVDIYELGLIYDIIVDADNKVLVKMTLTSPACPSAQQLPSEVRYKVKAIPEVTEAVVDIVWEPPWDKERMSDTAKLQLGFL